MPKRVLELEPNKTETHVRLLTVPEGLSGKYAALSYCWGEKLRPLLLTRQYLSLFSRVGIPLEQLPLTMRDACELCIALGIRFLWVDSLCIIQDSKDDWTQQSAAMGTIYSRAELTIQAAAGPDPDQSLFAKRSWKSQSEAELKCKDLQGAYHSCFVRGTLSSKYNIIEQRGWALQESLLSPRLLTFGTTEMSWECRSLYWNESGRLLKSISGFSTIFPRSIREKQFFHIDIDEAQRQRTESNTDLHALWTRIVANYGRRRLSISTDKLPALAGLAWWLSRSSLRAKDESYLAGLWKSQLPDGLLWYHGLPLQENAKKPEKYRAPSWSWASLDSEYLDWLEPSDNEDKIAKVLDCNVTCRGPDVFGEVLDGYLRISGPFKPGWLLPNNHWAEHFDFWGDDWKAERAELFPGKLESPLGRVWLDIYEETTPPSDSLKDGGKKECATKSYCLRICGNYGLLVEPISREADGTDKSISCEWRRFGVVRFGEDRAAEWWKGSEERDLVIR